MVAVDQQNNNDQNYDQSSSWSTNNDQQLVVKGWPVVEFRCLWKNDEEDIWWIFHTQQQNNNDMFYTVIFILIEFNSICSCLLSGTGGQQICRITQNQKESLPSFVFPFKIQLVSTYSLCPLISCFINTNKTYSSMTVSYFIVEKSCTHLLLSTYSLFFLHPNCSWPHTHRLHCHLGEGAAQKGVFLQPQTSHLAKLHLSCE